jgi:DNA polymerase-3 subunit delta'
VPQPEPHHHPDILVLEPLPANDDEAKKKDDGRPYARKRNINVEQIRAMLHRLHTRPTLGARRAVIVDAADHLEKGAVNALLKGLEEPPQGTFFLLVVHQPGRLLPTVRSRCQVLRFRPLEPAEMNAPFHWPRRNWMPRRARRDCRGAWLARRRADFRPHDLARPLALLRQISGRAIPTSACARNWATRSAPGPTASACSPRRGRAHRSGRGAAPFRARQPPGIIAAHERLVELGGEVPTHNFEPGLLIMEIGGLLAPRAG